MSARRGTNKLVAIFESEITAIGDPIELDGLDISRPHCFIGVQFFADAGGAVVAVPTTGDVTITVKTLNSQLWEAIPGAAIDASNPATQSWAANTTNLRAVPADVDVATHYKVVLTQNEV